MSVYNNNYKVVIPGITQHDGKPSLLDNDTEGKRRHYVKYINKFYDIVSFDPVYGKSGYSIDVLGYMTVWGDYLYYGDKKIKPGRYSPLTGFVLEDNTIVDYFRLGERGYQSENRCFTSAYMFDTIFKWDKGIKYGADSKLIYRGNSLEEYFKPYLAKIKTNIPTDRSLKDTLFKKSTIRPFGYFKVINNLGHHYGNYFTGDFANGYSWSIPMPMKLGISTTGKNKWLLRLDKTKQYIRNINLASWDFVMIEGSMTFYSDGTMSISKDTKLYHKSQNKILALTGHRYKGRPFDIIYNRQFDMEFLFRKNSYNEEGALDEHIYNYLDYTAKSVMVGDDEVRDPFGRNYNSFIPKKFNIWIAESAAPAAPYAIYLTEPDNMKSIVPEEVLEKAFRVVISWNKQPGVYYTNETYDITKQPEYLPWKKATKNIPHHIRYDENERRYPLFHVNQSIKATWGGHDNNIYAWHENYNPVTDIFTLGSNYLNPLNLDAYLKLEPINYDGGTNTPLQYTVSALSDNGIGNGLRYLKDTTSRDLKYDYTTRRKGDFYNSDFSYLLDYHGDIPYYTEEEYKTDIMAGIGIQKKSTGNSYHWYQKYIKKSVPGFNDFNPIIPCRKGMILGSTQYPNKSPIKGDVLTYDKRTQKFYYLKQDGFVDVVKLDAGRNYYNVNDLNTAVDRELKGVHLKMANRLKRHMLPLRALLNTDTGRDIPRSYSGDRLTNFDMTTYKFDNEHMHKVAIIDMFTTTVQYISWLPDRFPFEMLNENKKIRIYKDCPFRLVTQNREMFFLPKNTFNTSFPIDLSTLIKNTGNIVIIDEFPTYTEKGNRPYQPYINDQIHQGFREGDFWYLKGFLYHKPLPERTSYGASEMYNNSMFRSKGYTDKDTFLRQEGLHWDNGIPGFYQWFDYERIIVQRGVKKGWYHYYCTEDRDNSNKDNATFRYLFSEPVPQKEKVGDGSFVEWAEGGLHHAIYRRGLQDSDIANNPEKVFVDIKYKDIFYRNGGYQAGGLVNCKRRYKVVGAFGTGNHETDEVINIHYWNHNLNLTDDVYDHVQLSDKVEAYLVNSSSSDRKEYTDTKYYIGVDNRILYTFYHWGSLVNTWVYFEVDNEIVYQARINELYNHDYYQELDDRQLPYMSNSKGNYVISKRKMPVFDLDGKKVIFANYCFTKDEYNTFIKDSPLFYYEEEAKQGKYVIPEKYKAIQAKIDRGMPLKVYMHFHPDKDYWKNPTPVMGVTPNPFYGNQVFDFTKPPKLVGETKYINTTCDFGYNGNDGIVITLDNSMNAIYSSVYRQYEMKVSVTIFDERKDAYVTKIIKTNNYLNQATFVKKDTKLFTNKIILKSFETKLEGTVESPFDLDNGYPRLDASTTKITQTEYDRLKANKDSKILKVEIKVKPKYQGTYTRDFKTTYEFDYTYYFKNHTLVT